MSVDRHGGGAGHLGSGSDHGANDGAESDDSAWKRMQRSEEVVGDLIKAREHSRGCCARCGSDRSKHDTDVSRSRTDLAFPVRFL